MRTKEELIQQMAATEPGAPVPSEDYQLRAESNRRYVRDRLMFEVQIEIRDALAKLVSLAEQVE